MWTQVGARNYILDEGPSVKGQFWGERGMAQDMPGYVGAVLMPIGGVVCTRFDGGAHWRPWRIRLNRPCTAAMRHCVKLLWPLVIILATTDVACRQCKLQGFNTKAVRNHASNDYSKINKYLTDACKSPMIIRRWPRRLRTSVPSLQM